MNNILSLLFTLIVILAVFTHCSDRNSDNKLPKNYSDSKHSEIKELDSLKSFIDWVKENEENIATSLRWAISQSDSLNRDEEYIEKSIVVTEYDSSVLGELASRAKLIDSTLDVTYTVTKNFTEKPVIGPKAFDKDGYVDLNWKADKRIELDHFIFQYADTLGFEMKRKWE